MTKYHEKMIRIMNQFRKLNISDMLPGISRMEYLTMLIAMKAEDDRRISVSELIKRACVKPSAISRTLRGLEQKGYVERVVNPEDRRNTYVVMTEEGIAIMQQAEKIMKDFSDAVGKRVDQEEGERLLCYLNDVYIAAQEEISCRKWKNRKENDDE